MLQKYLEFAMKEDVPLKIISKNNKELRIKVLSFNSNCIKYQFLNNNEGTIKIENVQVCKCLKEDDEIQFNKNIIKEKYQMHNFEENIKNFESYYLEIIDLLFSREEKDSKRIS